MTWWALLRRSTWPGLRLAHDLVGAAQAKYMTWLVSWCTVTARAMADGVRSSELPDRWEPSPEQDEW